MNLKKVENCNGLAVDPNAIHVTQNSSFVSLYLPQQIHRYRQETATGNRQYSESVSEGEVGFRGAGDKGKSKTGEVGNGRLGWRMLESLAWEERRTIWQWVCGKQGFKYRGNQWGAGVWKWVQVCVISTDWMEQSGAVHTPRRHCCRCDLSPNHLVSKRVSGAVSSAECS